MVEKITEAYRVEKVALHYGSKPVFTELSFSVGEGEFLGILGPNGCGKTSLLRLMAGVLKPEQGRVELYGKELSRYSKKNLARIVSVLPQENPVDFPFSALEVVLMGRAPYLKGLGWETAADRKIAHESMKLTDCLQFADVDIRLLSGGERERVFLARALAQQPKVLLLDEPTTHLDLKHQAEIYSLLKKLHQTEKVTIIIVLHDLNFAVLSCEKILLLSKGHILANGIPENILNNDLLEKTYGTSVFSVQHPKNGKSLFIMDF